MADIKSRDMLIAEAVQKATMDSFYGRKVPSLKEIIASVPGDEPVAYAKFIEHPEAGGDVFYFHPNADIPEGSVALYTSPQPEPDTRRKAIEECIAHAKSYLDYHVKATVHYSGSSNAAMEYHLNRANAASNCLDALRTLLNKEHNNICQ